MEARKSNVTRANMARMDCETGAGCKCTAYALCENTAFSPKKRKLQTGEARGFYRAHVSERKEEDRARP